MTTFPFHRGNDWPVEHDRAVRDWAAGRLTMLQACDKSGLSKGQIIGRAHRLKLKILERGQRVAVSKGLPDPGPPRPIASQPAALFSDGCNWPLGDPHKPGFRFCGAKRASSKPPYCAEHLAASVPNG